MVIMFLPQGEFNKNCVVSAFIFIISAVTSAFFLFIPYHTTCDLVHSAKCLLALWSALSMVNASLLSPFTSLSFSVLREGMRGCLNHGVFYVGFKHFRKITLNFNGFRGRFLRRYPSISYLILNCTNQSCLLAGSLNY